MAKELFAGRLRKVVPFERDGSFFYRKARKHIENNNYIHALNYYRRKRKDLIIWNTLWTWQKFFQKWVTITNPI